MNNTSKDIIIEKTKQHIQEIRKNSPELDNQEMRIALGKVICELKLAKKHDNKILQKIFTLSK
ncbi:hypothetical protein OAR97_02650 [Arcobacteraceae bacterium]|nr:hypothetical protein [Arcobacteraceae bacterium]